MKNLDYALLLEVYGAVLTERQHELMEFYYWEDMSLGEISENLGITRQAVRDGIKRSEQTLIHLEQKLGFAEKINKTKDVFSDISKLALDIDNKNIYKLSEKGKEMFS